MRMLFGKYKGKDIVEVPDSYLDWLIGENWFIKNKRNKNLLKEIEEELSIRKRSHIEIKEEK